MLKNQNTLLPCESLGSSTSFSRTNTPWNLTLFPLDDIRFQLMQDYHHIIANTCLYSRIQSLFCVHGNRYKNNEIIHYYPLASHQRKIVFTRICYKSQDTSFWLTSGTDIAGMSRERCWCRGNCRVYRKYSCYKWSYQKKNAASQ